MDREKALSYFKRTGHIYIIEYCVYYPEDCPEAENNIKKYFFVYITEYKDFKAAENKYNKIIEEARKYGLDSRPVFANQTTAKRCFYPYGDVLD